MKPGAMSGKGFSLIEVIGALVIISIAAVFAGMLLSPSMQVYLVGRGGAEDSQKIQVAMNRLIKELTWVEEGTLQSPNDRTLLWVSSHPDRQGEGTQTVTWDGNNGSFLNLNGAPLMDNVASFEVDLTTVHVDIALSTTRAPTVIQTTRVFPRQMAIEPDIPML